MPIASELLFDEPRQLAFLATPAVVRTFVPPGKPGVYMLLRMDVAFYVGRSDKCVQTRLAGHPLLTLASHLTWEPCSDPRQAYRLESAWFHALASSTHLTNQIHPGHPTGENKNCPFCSTGDNRAWEHAMRPYPFISAVSPVAADQMAAAAKT